MGKKYKGTFDIPGGFGNKGGTPISDDMVVEKFNDLLNSAALPFVYKGMVVYSEAENAHFVWNGLDRTQVSSWYRLGGLFINTNIPPVTVGGFNNQEPATPPEGLSIQESLNKLLFPAVNPTVNFTTSGSAVYQEPAPTVDLSWSINVRTVNATVDTILVEFRRGSGLWSSLYSYDSNIDVGSYSTTAQQLNSGNSSIEDYNYRITVTDSVGATTVVNKTINTKQVAYFGASTRSSYEVALLSDANINKALVTSKGNTFSGVDPLEFEFTYYLYPDRFGNLSEILLDGVENVIGAFTKIESAVSITNAFGETDTYNVYKSNSQNAFTNVTLKFV